MAVRAPSYVESWDKREFPELPVRLSLEDLSDALLTMSVGHGDQGAEEFPFHREKSGLVRFDRERVVATADGDVLRGHVAVANAIVESWCAGNPVLFASLIDEWIDKARAADDEDKESRRREDERLAYHPHLAEALQRSAAKVFEQAGLTPHQVRVLELRLEGKSFTEIGFAFSVSKQMAADYVDKALEKILALDVEVVVDA